MSLIPALDLFPLFASVLVLVGCTLLGNFLILRRQSLMGDALSHTVLPGVVGAYLVFGSRDPFGLFLGALIAGLLTVASIEALRRYGRIESNTAMGVVFSIAFAVGVILIRVGHTDHVDLDPNCVLYGQLELMVWFDAPASFFDIDSTNFFYAVPSSIWSLLIMVLLVAIFVVVFFKELRLVSFDPGLAHTLGFSSGVVNILLMLLVSVATVASFEAVGSVLVIAALLVPASTARLFTDRLKSQILVSVLVAFGCAVLGYLLSTWIPLLWQGESLKASGTITVFSGFVFAVSLFFSPRHGYWTQRIRARQLADQVAVEDVVVLLHTSHETSTSFPWSTIDPRVLGLATQQGLIQSTTPGQYLLSDVGRSVALEVQGRRNRWLAYLVNEVGLAPDHAPGTAEHLEHFGDDLLQKPSDTFGKRSSPPGDFL